MPRYRQAKCQRGCFWPLNCLGVFAAFVAACIATNAPFVLIACSTTVACAADPGGLFPARTKIQKDDATFYLTRSSEARDNGCGLFGCFDLYCKSPGPEFGNVISLANNLGAVRVGQGGHVLISLAITLLFALVPLSCVGARVAGVYHSEGGASVLQLRRPLMRALASAHLGATMLCPLLIFVACNAYKVTVLEPLLASAQVAAVTGARAAAAGKTACSVSSPGMSAATMGAVLALIGAPPLCAIYFLCLPYPDLASVVDEMPNTVNPASVQAELRSERT